MYYYIINPTAGRGKFTTIQEKLRAALNQCGISGEFVKTTGPGDATRLAQKAAASGFATIVAVGGDETVNEVINGLSDAKSAVGIIPIGNSNNLAEHFGITTWQQAVAVLAARRLSDYSLIASGQKYFLSNLTLGFETDLDKRLEYNQDTRLAAKLSQTAKSWGHARNFGTLKGHIEVDDSYELDLDIFSLTVVNQKFLNPLSQNQLLVSITRQPNRRELTRFLWSKAKHAQTSTDDRATTRFGATKLMIETEPTTGIMIDGKVSGRTPIVIRMTDKKIRFICEKPSNSFRPAEN